MKKSSFAYLLLALPFAAGAANVTTPIAVSGTRFSQDRQTQRVTVYQVVASDSIEERILDMQESKAKLADEVVDGESTGYSLSRLTREDLENLLG